MNEQAKHTPSRSAAMAIIRMADGEDCTIETSEVDAIAEIIDEHTAAPWHALLLRAVLKGWALKRMPHGNKTTDLICGDVVLADYHSPFFRLGVCEYGQIPACPDAETFERIRKAVDGD